MIIPEKIRIGGHDVVVRICPTCDMFNTSGDYDSEHMQIRVKSDCAESRQAETFMHEIFEAICHLNNLELEHKELSIISEQLFAVIRNNGLRFEE